MGAREALFALLKAALGQGRAAAGAEPGAGDGAKTRARDGALASSGAGAKAPSGIGTLTPGEWRQVYDLAARQGMLAVAWDGVCMLPTEQMPPRELKIGWSYNVVKTEQNYERQRALIARLAELYGENGIQTMVLKGYGLSLCYPVPEHRSCSDIDIWLYGKQQQADDLLRRAWNMPIDEDKHHHTTFVADGILVENHYDFINVQSHLSNRKIERLLQQYARTEDEQAEAEGAAIRLPGANFNALFLLRHAAMHFAAGNICLRQVADWMMFAAKYHAQTDWPTILQIVREANMHRFMYALSAIAVDCLGADPATLPPIERNPPLERRVLDGILSPATGEVPRECGALKIMGFKLRRWWSNRWKHRIVYREGLLQTFVVQVFSHLYKPKSILR